MKVYFNILLKWNWQYKSVEYSVTNKKSSKQNFPEIQKVKNV